VDIKWVGEKPDLPIMIDRGVSVGDEMELKVAGESKQEVMMKQRRWVHDLARNGYEAEIEYVEKASDAIEVEGERFAEPTHIVQLSVTGRFDPDAIGTQ
jgi:hypothetical protein